MGKTRNKKVILGIMMAITFIAGILATEFVYADHVSSLPSARIAQSLEVLFVDIGLIKTETDKVQMVKDNQYIPFLVKLSTNETCDPVSTSGGDFDVIRITNNAAFAEYVITGIILKPRGIDSLSDDVRVNFLFTAGTTFDMDTIDITTIIGPNIGNQVPFDIMGVQLTSGGNFPHQIVNNGLTKVSIFCKAAGTDITFDSGDIVVSGWKQVGDSITVTYSETA